MRLAGSSGIEYTTLEPEERTPPRPVDTATASQYSEYERPEGWDDAISKVEAPQSVTIGGVEFSIAELEAGKGDGEGFKYHRDPRTGQFFKEDKK